MPFIREPQKFTLVPTGPTTGTTGASQPVTAYNYRGVTLTLDATGKTGSSPTLDVKLQGRDPVSGKWYDVHGAAYTQITDDLTAPRYLTVYPGVAETGGQTVSDLVPRTFRVYTTISGTGAAWTLGVGAVMVP